MQEYLKNMPDWVAELFGEIAPKLLGAVAILVGGALAAWIISRLVRAALKKTSIDNRIAAWLAGDDRAKEIHTEKWVSKGVFYVLMLFVLMGFFQALGLTMVSGPLEKLVSQLTQYAPRLLGAGALLLLAWIVATALRMIITRVLGAARVDERLGSQTAEEAGEEVPLTKTLGEVVYWLVLALFLPVMLGVLGLQGLLAPVNSMMSKALAFVPNIIAINMIPPNYLVSAVAFGDV